MKTAFQPRQRTCLDPRKGGGQETAHLQELEGFKKGVKKGVIQAIIEKDEVIEELRELLTGFYEN
jgi:hypothetical protein